MDLSRLLELNEAAKKEGGCYLRRREGPYAAIRGSTGKHFPGIMGPRGVGKSVLLKQLTLEIADSFYLSVDTLGEENLFEVAKILSEKYKIRSLFLDEIHFKRGFEGELKKIFDFLPLKIVFTSSVALAILESAHDLSRRVELIPMHPFSLREFVLFKTGTDVPILTFEDIAQKNWSPLHMRFGYLLEEYLRGGLFPFSLEEPNPQALFQNILQKITHKDIPMVARLHTEEIPLLEKIVAFAGRSPVDGINLTSLSKNIGITKYKAEIYLNLLKKSFLLNPVYPFGTNVLKEPKVLMSLPYRLLYRSYEEGIGALREDFAAQMLLMSQAAFFYLKSTRGMKTPDFLIREGSDEWVLEVGGKGKGRGQFKGFEAKRKLRLVHSDDCEGDKRPLFLLGFLK